LNIVETTAWRVLSGHYVQTRKNLLDPVGRPIEDQIELIDRLEKEMT